MSCSVKTITSQRRGCHRGAYTSINIFFLFLLYAPFLTIYPIQRWDSFYTKIANKYECYPVETCKADSYSVTSVTHAITTYSKGFGTGTLTHMQFFAVGVKNGVVLLYVVGRWNPFMMRRYWTGK